MIGDKHEALLNQVINAEELRTDQYADDISEFQLWLYFVLQKSDEPLEDLHITVYGYIQVFDLCRLGKVCLEVAHALNHLCLGAAEVSRDLSTLVNNVNDDISGGII